jgi:peptidyl-prolyl cis-trans isomerase SurA
LKKLESQSDFSVKAIASQKAIFQEKENKKKGSSSIAEKLKFESGISKVYKHNGQYLVYNIAEVKPVKQLEFEEVRGRVISDYQDQLEKEWIAKLNTTYNLVIYENELEKVRKEFE